MAEIKLTEKEKRLVEALRQIAHGQVTVFLQDGQPVRIERIKESIKL